MAAGATERHWTPQRRLRALELFDEAEALPEQERFLYLERATAGDPELRERLEVMLEAAGADFLDAPLLSFAETPAVSSGRTTVVAGGHGDLDGREGGRKEGLHEGLAIGPYRILRPLGRGGMGEVFLARQLEPVERTVALKLLRRNLGGDCLRRFRAESALLARIEHPNVARLYDAGTGGEQDGAATPYLVLEWVDGLPLDRHCDEGKLSLDERISLFRQVCAGVQAAHARLLVHRDIKPANILVAADGTPKLLDFGVAKLLDPEGSQGPETRTGLRLLTPRYASPEQILGDALDTRSDVYSLGVVLYELLTGTSPYATSAEGRRLEDAICREPPRRPSEAAAGLSRQEATGIGRGTHGGQVAHRLRGDLDTILLKALRKDPAHRYGSAEALAEDLRRWQERLPIRARPESWTYRAGKLLSRHRLAAAVSAVLLGALAVSGALYLRELREHVREMDRERIKAEQVSELLIEMLTTVEGARPPGEGVTASELLAAGARRVGAAEAQEPVTRASLLQTIGQVFHELNRDQEAAESLRESLRLLEGMEGVSAGERADVLQALGNVERDLGNLSEADRLLREALALRRNLRHRRPDRLADVLRDLALLSWDRLDFPATENYFRQALRWSTAESGGGRDQWLDNLQAVAEFSAAPDLLAESVRRREEQLQSRRSLLGEAHPDVAVTLLELGDLAARRGDRHHAEDRYREGHDLLLEALGPQHPLTETSVRRLAATLAWLGRYEEAESLYRRILAELAEDHAADDPEVLFARHNLGVVLGHQGKFQAGQAALREVLTGLRSRYPEEDCKTAPVHFSLGRSLHLEGRLAEADHEYGLADAACADRGEDRPYLPTEVSRAYLRLDQGREDEVCGELFRRFQELPPPEGGDPAGYAELQGLWGICLLDGDHLDEGRRHLEESLRTLRHRRGDAYPPVRWIEARLHPAGGSPVESLGP